MFCDCEAGAISGDLTHSSNTVYNIGIIGLAQCVYMEHCVGRVVVGLVGGLVALAILSSVGITRGEHLDALDVSLETIQFFGFRTAAHRIGEDHLDLRCSRVSTVSSIYNLFLVLQVFVCEQFQMLKRILMTCVSIYVH